MRMNTSFFKDTYNSLDGRDKLAEYLSDSIESNPSENFNFYGCSGVGKKYVLNNILNKIGGSFRIIRFVFGEPYEQGKKIKRFNIGFGVESMYLPINFNISKNQETKLANLVNSLRRIFNKENIIFYLTDYEKVELEVREIIERIIKEKVFFEKELRVKICTIITSEEKLDIDGITHIEFLQYEEEDVKQYIEKYLNCDPDQSYIFSKKLSKLCGANLKLIKYAIEAGWGSNKKFTTSSLGILDYILNYKINKLKQKGKECYNLLPSDFETIIEACATSNSFFTVELIKQVCEMHGNAISNSFKIACEEYLFKKENNYLHDFELLEVKENIRQKINSVEKSIKFYNYFTENYNDEYFQRASYLLSCTGAVDDNVMALLLLAISKAMTFSDNLIEEEVKKIISPYLYDEIQWDTIKIFIDANKSYNNKENSKALALLSKIKNPLTNFNKVGLTEYYRLLFKIGYEGKMKEFLPQYLARLILCTEDDYDLSLDLGKPFSNKQEVVLKMRIMYDIAPYILDDLNDVSRFEKIYDRSRKLERNEKESGSIFFEYAINVFNRKAFLFANPAQAHVYYEEAEQFFFKNQIWEQYLMTLAGKAGVFLVQGRYNEAVNTCHMVFEKQKEENIKINIPERLLNNMLVADFLLFESNAKENLIAIKNKALETAKLLYDLIGCNTGATKHVILLNVASLYLYANKELEYSQIKVKIENSLNCEDVSDIADESVNDFYRYRFVWMEIFRNIRNQNWSQAQTLLDSIRDFIPALSHKEEILVEKKINATQEIIMSRKNVDAYYFCNNLYIDKRAAATQTKFYYRGLPLSDLQYTSFG